MVQLETLGSLAQEWEKFRSSHRDGRLAMRQERPELGNVPFVAAYQERSRQRDGHEAGILAREKEALKIRVCVRNDRHSSASLESQTQKATRQ
jgi:hypothetical protein